MMNRRLASWTETKIGMVGTGFLHLVEVRIEIETALTRHLEVGAVTYFPVTSIMTTLAMETLTIVCMIMWIMGGLLYASLSGVNLGFVSDVMIWAWWQFLRLVTMGSTDARKHLHCCVGPSIFWMFTACYSVICIACTGAVISRHLGYYVGSSNLSMFIALYVVFYTAILLLN